VLAIALPAQAAVEAPVAKPLTVSSLELVMIGTSTGGPQALTRLVAALPKHLRVPVCIALHIPIGYTKSLAERLDKLTPLRVVEANSDIVLEPGLIVLARGGSHLRVHRSAGRLVTEVSTLPARAFAPCVDELFESGSRAVGAGALGIVLTGMGDDGLAGARAIAGAGGTLITESAATCVVYGMPRSVDEAKLGAHSLPLEAIGAEIGRIAG
jgi:two-component system chemotaxis response regulator CheB